jgi:hypothetical protein
MISCGIVVMFDGQAGELLLKPRAGAQPDQRPCNTLGSMLVRRKRTELFKMRDHCACIDHGKLEYQTPLRFSGEQATVRLNLASKRVQISLQGVAADTASDKPCGDCSCSRAFGVLLV